MMEFKNPYWTNTTKIELLQNWIIVHSIIYYEHDTTLVTDDVYDKNSMQLLELIRKYPKSAKLSKYAYCFKEYDGSTGFDLPGKLNKADRKKFNGIVRTVLRKNTKGR